MRFNIILHYITLHCITGNPECSSRHSKDWQLQSAGTLRKHCKTRSGGSDNRSVQKRVSPRSTERGDL